MVPARSCWSAPTWTRCRSSSRPACPTPARSTARDKQGRDVGVMHACGHDMHMTCFVGTARWLGEHKDRWSGTVVMIAQPAEEAIGGARNMLKRRPLLAVPQARFRPGVALPRQRAGRRRLLSPRSAAGELDLAGRDDPRQGRPRRLAAQDGRPDRPGGPRHPRSSRRSSAARSSRSSRPS